MGTCIPDCLARNAINRSRYIGIFTTAAAVFSVSTLTWTVMSDGSREQPTPDDHHPLVQAALHEQRVIGIVALVVNIGWLVVAVLLVAAAKTLSPRLTVPFLFWAALYLPFCLAVAGVCLRRLAALSAADQGRPLVPRLASSAAMCLLAGPVYTVLMLIVAAARRQMVNGEETRQLAKR